MCCAGVEPISAFAKPFIGLPRRCEMKNQLTRRDFIKLVSAAGGGLVLAVYLDACASGATLPPPFTRLAPTSSPQPLFDWAPSFYLRMDQAVILAVYTLRFEMAEGIRTAIAMLIAEEI